MLILPVTDCTILSNTARRTLSGVAGLNKPKNDEASGSSGLNSLRAYRIESRTAKKAAAARKNGGSPTAFEECIARGLGQSCLCVRALWPELSNASAHKILAVTVGRTDGQTFRRFTLNTLGTSLAVGILYAPGPVVAHTPVGRYAWCLSPHFISSSKHHPRP